MWLSLEKAERHQLAIRGSQLQDRGNDLLSKVAATMKIVAVRERAAGQAPDARIADVFLAIARKTTRNRALHPSLQACLRLNEPAAFEMIVRGLTETREGLPVIWGAVFDFLLSKLRNADPEEAAGRKALKDAVAKLRAESGLVRARLDVESLVPE